MTFSNPIEQSLLNDLMSLYRDDLTREFHETTHETCPACSKEALIAAIHNHQKLNENLILQSEEQ